jgi:hypothetical protein
VGNLQASSPTIATAQPHPQPPQVVCAWRLIKKLDELRDYKTNWGTQNEPPVSKKACDRAEHFVSYFSFSHPMLRLHIYPTPGGDVAIDWKLDGKAHTAIFEETEICLLSDDDEFTYTNELELYRVLTPQEWLKNETP